MGSGHGPGLGGGGWGATLDLEVDSSGVKRPGRETGRGGGGGGGYSRETEFLQPTVSYHRADNKGLSRLYTEHPHQLPAFNASPLSGK